MVANRETATKLLYIRYKMYKKIVHGHRTNCAKKE